MPYRISLFLSLLLTTLLWTSCSKDNNDNNTPNEPALVVSLPIANVGDEVSFSVTNYQGYPTGYRFDPGDGSGPMSTNYSSFTHTYNSPGTYTITATVFENNQSTTLTASITVEGVGGTIYGPSIKIREIELITLERPYEDIDVYQNNDPGFESDPFFSIKVIYDDQNNTTDLIYPRSSTKMNTQTGTWSFTNEIPNIYYEEDIREVHILFEDDDSAEGSGDDFAGRIIIYNFTFAPYVSSKPTEIQWTYMGTAVNMTVDWID